MATKVSHFTHFGPKHFVRTAVDEISQICQPLFNKMDLTYFHYFKLYQDGSAFVLYSRMDWSDYFYKNNFRAAIPLPKQQIQIEKYNLCLWRGILRDKIVSVETILILIIRSLSVSLIKIIMSLLPSVRDLVMIIF